MNVLSQTESTTDMLECLLCRTRHRVRDLRTLRRRSTATCRHCGAAFVVMDMPDSSAPLTEGQSGDAETRPAASSELVSSPETKAEVLRFAFNGRGGTLFGIQVVNMFLTLLTLGLYYFWAKVRIRRYLFSQAGCAGDRFAYHGTGRELLTGFAKAALVFGVPYFMLAIVPDLLEMDEVVRSTAGWLSALVVFLFVPVAVVSARRYRCSRTSWRNIRFSFRGRVWDFVKLTVKGSLLNILTLGAYYPYYQVQRQDFLTTHTYFGSQPLGFDGEAAPLVPSYTTALLLTPVLASVILMLPWWGAALEAPGLAILWILLPYLLMVLTIVPLWIWFLAKKQRYFWNSTFLGNSRCRCTLTGRKLLNLKIENFFILVLTLGCGWPWVTVRTTRFYLDHLTLEGHADVDAIQQDAQSAQPTGEGLADMLDIGFDIDF